MPVLVTLRQCAVAVAVVMTAGAALAQNYPNRVIKIIVPFGVGGQPDVVARVFAQHLAATVGTTVIDNRPGANTTIGSKAAASAEPDGYTLLFGSSTSLAIAPALNQNAGYDPVKSFIPIAGISSSPMYLAVGPSVQAKTVAELVVHAKSASGKIEFCRADRQPAASRRRDFQARDGDRHHAGSLPQHEPSHHRLLAGQMDIVFDSPAPLAALLRDGKIRALVAMGSKRMPELPDVPTMAESGLPDLRVVTWNGLVAPAGTPDAIVAKLNAVHQ